MSAVGPEPNEVHPHDEGSWVYLSLDDEVPQDRTGFRREVIETCRASGWPAVSWSPPAHRGHRVSRYIEGMDHAVENADVVVVMLDGESAVTDAELTFAYRHNRPVIGLSLAGTRPQGSAIRRMMHSYERARVVECDDLEGCVTGLREVLSDDGFLAIVDEAAREAFGHV